MRVTGHFLSAAVLLVVANACLADGPNDSGVAAITRPSGDVSMSFTSPGRVDKVLVKQGQEVQFGQVLAQLDDTAERLEMETLKAQAEDTTRIKAAEAELAQKKSDLNKFEYAFKHGASTDQEVENARLEVVIADLSVDLAKFQHQQDEGKFKAAEAQVNRMRLISPIAGVVEKLSVEAGEVADMQKESIRLVSIDPLWIDVPVPLSTARKLKADQSADVEVPLADGRPGGNVTCKVVHIAAVADAASDTLMVRIEMPNPERRPAGEHVQVRFPQIEEPTSMASNDQSEVTSRPAKEQ